MRYKIKKTTLADGNKSFDIDLFTNGQEAGNGAHMCVFSCTSGNDAVKFFSRFKELVKEHTVETLKIKGVKYEKNRIR